MRMSISDIREKIKHINEDTLHNLFVVGIIVVVAISAFAIGRLSVSEEGSVATVAYPEEIVKRAQMSLSETQTVVASVRGTKYHYPWCSGATNMSEKNKIEFDSIEKAREAGYSPAANCDGLE